MGTRHLTMITLNGKRMVANYGQWDGYPTGQGYTIADFLGGLTKTRLDSFKKKVAVIKPIKDAEIEPYWIACGANAGSDFITLDVSDKFRNRYPEFSRDTGADILWLIHWGIVDKTVLSEDFLKDSLFCEYAYDIDLDKQVVRFYNGGKKPSKVIKFKDFTRKLMNKLKE